MALLPRTTFGPRVRLHGLKDLFAPQKVERFQIAPAGIDNLALASTDTFQIAGRGEVTVDFEGFFRVARAKPTTREWATAETSVNMVEIDLAGSSQVTGPIRVSINPRVVSPGQVFAAGGPTAAAACRIATSVQFSVPRMGMTLFNKEPILLMNDAIESVPPVEDPNGAAHLYRLPLFDLAKPNGQPVAYLLSLRYTVGNYLTAERVSALRRKNAG